MPNLYKKILRNAGSSQDEPDVYRKLSYSQSGEDLIINFLFDAMGNTTPSYIDIGAHHPRYINNTAIFYDLGSRGINIEPDPILFKEFLANRPDDINLNIGVSAKPTAMDFYIMSAPTLNTTSMKSVKEAEKMGYSLDKKIKIHTKNINYIIKKYLKAPPNLINLDAEGMDYEILKSLDFVKYAPDVLCIETTSFAHPGHGTKDRKIANFLRKKAYMLYADTNINSIFVKKSSLGLNP